MVCGIYYILNKENGKIYIGQSTNMKKRLMKHKSHLRGNYHHSEHLQNAWNKYGEDSFEFSFLKECDESELDKLEKQYIAYYDSSNREHGYNKEKGGNKNKHVSLETRRKISEANKGENSSWYGKHHTDETRRKISEANKGEKSYWYGKHPSDETRRKNSEANKGENNAQWGTSEIEDWGGFWFLKNMASSNLSLTKIVAYTGISKGAIQKYIKVRGYTWTQLKKELRGDERYSIIDDFGGLNFLIDCIKEGKSQNTIAKEIGLNNSSSIQYYLKTRSYTWTQLKKELTADEQNSIDDFGGLNFLIDCVKKGKTQESVAKEIGLTADNIYYYLKCNGYTWKKLKEEITGDKRYSIDELGGLHFLRDCIKEGKTKEEVEEEFKVSTSTITRYLKKRGYTWTQLKKEVSLD